MIVKYTLNLLTGPTQHRIFIYTLCIEQKRQFLDIYYTIYSDILPNYPLYFTTQIKK